MDTIELTVNIDPKDPWSEIAIAELAELGFDSFVSTDSGFIAYAESSVDANKAMDQTSLVDNEDVTVKVSVKIIPYQNWNTTWEENFPPVHVEEYISILAPFHDRSSGKGMVVEIQPQMSFGTGHHQTTWMMTKALFELEQIPDAVLDMGTGTGVLAIVAEKLGSRRILAIDIEDWSVENAKENAHRNECKSTECLCGDVDLLGGECFGLIIANINKNTLKSHMATYTKVLEPNGILLLSGFFASDIDEMIAIARNHGLVKEKLFNRDEWAGIQLRKIN